MQIEIEVFQDQLDSSLGLLEESLSGVSLSRYLRSGGVEALQERVRARFAGEGDAASGDWADLRAATVRRRIAAGYPGSNPINVRTGAMQQWLAGDRGAHLSGPSTAEAVWPGPGGDLEGRYATAQIGSSNPRTVPRPVVAANLIDLRLLLSGIAEHIAAMSGVELV